MHKLPRLPISATVEHQGIEENPYGVFSVDDPEVTGATDGEVPDETPIETQAEQPPIEAEQPPIEDEQPPAEDEPVFALGTDLQFMLECFLMHLETAAEEVGRVWESVKAGNCSAVAAYITTSLALKTVTEAYEELVNEYPAFTDIADFYNAVIGGTQYIQESHRTLLHQLKNSGVAMSSFATVFHNIPVSERRHMYLKQGVLEQLFGVTRF